MLARLSALLLSDPATAALANGPMDDEPVTDREAEAITQGESRLRPSTLTRRPARPDTALVMEIACLVDWGA